MNNDSDPMQLLDTYKEESSPQQEQVTDPTPVLSLPIADEDLIAYLKMKEKKFDQYAQSDLKLQERSKKNRDFWRGNHYEDETRFEQWQVPFKDNIIYQDLEARITLASARPPLIIVNPPNDNNTAVENAQEYEKILGVKVNNKVTQRLVKRGLRFHHLNFFAVAKGRWDPNLANGTGDFVFELVRPERFKFDHTATIPDTGFTADNLDWTIEYIEEPVGIVYAKFPTKKAALQKLIAQSKDMDVSKIKYKEAWFTWYDNEGQIYEAVCWYFRDLVLDKQRNPYYDWEGYKATVPGQQKDGTFRSSLTKEQKFYNYFERPRKPYIFFTYQNLDESPIDDTTPVEQAIPIQKLINRTGRQITEIADRAVPKVIVGATITKEEARRLTDDPAEILWVDAGDLTKAVTVIPAAPPSPELLNLQIAARGRVDALFSTHSTTRGESGSSNESGLSKQITREGDLTASDDLVDIVVERVVGEMAGWATQFMKMFYDQPHYIRQIGQDGSVLFKEFSRTDIQDGIMIDVKASATDAMTRRSDAVNLASRKAIDPLSMFEDMDMPNPKERVRRLVSFLNGTNDAFASYMAEIDVEFEHQNATPPGQPGGDNANDQQAQSDLQSMVAGQIITPPDHFDATYVKVFIDFIHSGQFEQLDPQIQSNFKDYIKQLQDNFQNFNTQTGNNLAPSIPQVGVQNPGAALQ